MGCTSSKYQGLSAEPVPGSSAEAEDSPPGAREDGPPGALARPGGDAIVTTPDPKAEPTTPVCAETPPLGNTPGGSDEALPAAVGPPPWGGAAKQSVMPEFEPPLVENVGDDEVIDMEEVSENLEQKVPPWKESDKIRPPMGFNKFEQTLRPAIDVPEAAALAPEVWEDLTAYENTVIIFDWDDTLLCSSALHCCLPNQFLELEETVESILHLSMTLGRTIIVTNAMESWIQETARRFMPRLMPTLERLLIVYARKNWERIWPGDTFAWKREGFRELLHDKLGSDMNLIVIGDSLSEIRAAEALHPSLGSSALVKTIKFKALPSPAELLGELRAIAPELAKLVQQKCSASKEMFQDRAASNMFQPNIFQGHSTWQMLDAVPFEMFAPHTGTQALLWSSVAPVSAVSNRGYPPTQITI